MSHCPNSLTASYTKQLQLLPTPTIDLVLIANRLRNRRRSSPVTSDNHRTFSTGRHTTPRGTRHRARQNPRLDSHIVIRRRRILRRIFRISPEELQNLLHAELADVRLGTALNCLIRQFALLLLEL